MTGIKVLGSTISEATVEFIVRHEATGAVNRVRLSAPAEYPVPPSDLFDRLIAGEYWIPEHQSSTIAFGYHIEGEKIAERLEKQNGEVLELSMSFAVWVKQDGSENWIKFQPAPIAVEQIYRFLRSRGASLVPLKEFLTRLSKNPRYRAREHTFQFLRHTGMTITDSGTILGYKAVREDFRDLYSGKIENLPGRVIEMDPAHVCDDPTIGCGAGLHVGSYEYALRYGSDTSQILLVEVNPEDVVCIPHEFDYQKLRCHRYTVVAVFRPPVKEKEETNPLTAPVVALTPEAAEKMKVPLFSDVMAKAVEILAALQMVDLTKVPPELAAKLGKVVV